MWWALALHFENDRRCISGALWACRGMAAGGNKRETGVCGLRSGIVDALPTIVVE